MKRREFVALTAASAVAAASPRLALAQQPARMPRVVYFTAVSMQPGPIGRRGPDGVGH